MARTTDIDTPTALPAPAAVLELLKPITWFAPMWAFMCGIVSTGKSPLETWPYIVAGAILAGPLLCATSQAVNDWFDRHVDAINEPQRPIPSGRIPGQWGLRIAIIWSGFSIAFAATLGPWVLGAAIAGLALAWAYSMPPVRLKLSGVWGPGAVALSYEGLAWFTGAAVVSGAMPRPETILLAVLYSAGAHGIMTLNDFKAIEGDRAMGIRSLPVTLGVAGAAQVACLTMALPQLVVVAALIGWGAPVHAALVALSVGLQGVAMIRLVRDPRRYAPWYNGTGVVLFVLGMLVAALAVAGLGGASA